MPSPLRWMTGTCATSRTSVLIQMVYWPGCNSVFPQYAAVGNSKLPFRTGCALACTVVKPSAKPSSAKPMLEVFPYVHGYSPLMSLSG